MIDIHCHLDAKYTPEQLREFIDSTKLHALISCGIKPSSWYKHIELKEYYPINISLGIHPFFVEDSLKGALDSLDKLIQENDIVAIGEIGLDYHKEQKESREYQIEVFQKQIQLAKKHNLPIIIHCRKAHQDLFPILKKEKSTGMIFHSFSGGENELETALSLGAYISFGFPINYRNNKKQQHILSLTPIDRVVFETDSPYMKINLEGDECPPNPLDIELVYKKAAEILCIPINELILQIRENVKTAFPKIVSI
ncbi:MAG: hypothetical protein A2Y40_10855 [Candidatus Margulisbacteria bacterium GWF2_35_9]|nr:MAG: hypothetical protein A2Y40_10855 [Candidatus Margulisbacteria bacterium GWF2_35_9]